MNVKFVKEYSIPCHVTRQASLVLLHSAMCGFNNILLMYTGIITRVTRVKRTYFIVQRKQSRCTDSFFSDLNTAKLVYSGHATQRALYGSRNLFVEPTESWSDSHRKAGIQRTLLQRTIVIADTIFWDHVEIFNRIFLFIGGTSYFLWGSENESRYIALFGFSGSIKMLLSIDCVNIYIFSIFCSIDLARWKSIYLFIYLFIYLNLYLPLV